jgi:C-terminal processing protease CtpA/Prc
MKKIMALVAMLIPLFMFAEQKTIGYFGILSEPINEAMMAALDIEHGVLITKVYENTPAEQAGFEIGDVIYEIEGEKIVDIEALKTVVAKHPNEKVTIKFLHSGEHLKKSVVFGEKETVKMPFEIPNMQDFKKALETGKNEFREQLQKLEKEIELLKQEIEDIKRQLQEQ